MGAETIIVECGVCGQPFDAPITLFPMPIGGELTVPRHPRLLATGEPGTAECDGGEIPAHGKGGRDQWERGWRERHPDASVPDILPGDRVRVRRIR